MEWIVVLVNQQTGACGKRDEEDENREVTFLFFLVELVKVSRRRFRKLRYARFRIPKPCSSLISTSNSTQDWSFAR
jgi:hypothetical protein